ncbi:MAG: hypothetical protein KGJ13_12550, partial [Patescibacteria group bacterium]|nr:hypothetical protein [Patescibacteria group bacterium]
EFEELGFVFGASDLCASAFGVSQERERERLFFVAHSIGSTATGRSPPVRRLGRHEEMEETWRCTHWRESCEVGVLDDGLPSSLVKAITKGFGNAIVPQVGKAFVETFMEYAA